MTPSAAGQPRVDWAVHATAAREDGGPDRGRSRRGSLEPRPVRPAARGQGVSRHPDGLSPRLSPVDPDGPASRRCGHLPVTARLHGELGRRPLPATLRRAGRHGMDVHGEATFVSGWRPSTALDAGCGTGQGGPRVGPPRDRCGRGRCRRLDGGHGPTPLARAGVGGGGPDRSAPAASLRPGGPGRECPAVHRAGTQEALVAAAPATLAEGGRLVAGFPARPPVRAAPSTTALPRGRAGPGRPVGHLVRATRGWTAGRTPSRYTGPPTRETDRPPHVHD